MKNIKQLSVKELAGKIAIVRVDFNVPFRGSRIVETFRIDQVWPTIDFLLKKRAKVLLISHLGDEGASLAPVARFLNQRQKTKLATNVKQAREWLRTNDLVLLENLRFWPGEKNNDQFFAKELASLGDLYVNDAFSVSHRTHASVVGLPKFLPSYAGLRLVEEVKNLTRVIDPRLPLLVILGGAKFKTKIPLLKKLAKAEKIFIGGALSNSFFKTQGLEVGQSVVDSDLDYIKPFLKKKNLVLPLDVLVEAEKNKKLIKRPTDICPNEKIFDIGPETLKEIAKAAARARTILWNGPLGWFEDGHTQGTFETAKILAKARAFTVVGGGDTLVAIKKLKLENKFSFVSTGGGAMLDYIASGGKLPGLKVLK